MAYEAQLAAYKRFCDRVTTRMLKPLDAPTFWQDTCTAVSESGPKKGKVYCFWREARGVNSTMSTKFEATERVLAEVKRAVETLTTIRKTDVNANGVFIQPRQKLVALKAAREHINRAIEAIESKWPQ